MSPAATSRRRHRLHDLARRLAGRQQGGARTPLRRVGGERADARVRGRRRRDGPGRARPRALDLSRLKALGVEAARRRPRRRRAPDVAARRRAPRLDGADRGQPAGRRRAHDVRRRLRRQHARADGPAGAQDPAGGGLPPRARRGVGQAPVPRRRGPARRAGRAAVETWEHAGRWAGPTDDPGFRAALAQGMVRRDAGPAARAGARLAGRPAGRRGRGDHARGALGLVALGPRPAPLEP